MNNRAFNIGIIGLGGVAQAHLQGFSNLKNLDIVAMCDIDQVIGNRIAEQYSARYYHDYRELLGEGGVDLVLVLTPASTHRQIVESTAAAGIHVFCEKPLAVSLADGEAMVATCRDAGVKFLYGSSYRYLPAIIKAREFIQSGELGDIMLMTEQVIGGQG